MNGIWYIQQSFPLGDVPPAILGYVPLMTCLAQSEDQRERLCFRTLVYMARELEQCLRSHRQSTDVNTHRRFVLKQLAFDTLWRQFVMAKQQGKPTDANRSEWKGFVELRLSETQLTELDTWKCPPAATFELLSRLVFGGYRWTASYNPQRKLACVVITANSPDIKWNGYGMSSFDTDCYAAAKMAVYKHFYVLNEDWTLLLDQPDVSRGRG